MKVLIVHAHHEAQSFCSALSDAARKQLEKAGHHVVVSDLYKMRFDPVSDRRNFTTIKDADYLKQQQEEMYATEKNGFAPELDAEIKKLEECDAIILSFPLWWFGYPAILKGWVDKVFAMGRIYGGEKLYENGIGQSRKRGLVIMTTGGGEASYDGWGPSPPMTHVLGAMQHGTFWFNGILPLEPFIAWSPIRISDDERKNYLKKVEEKMDNLFREEPVHLPKLADFPNWGTDTKPRFHVVARGKFELGQLAAMKRDGLVFDSEMSADQKEMFIKARANSESELRERLAPLAKDLNLEVTQLAKMGIVRNQSPATR